MIEAEPGVVPACPTVLLAAFTAPLVARLRATFGGRARPDRHPVARERTRLIDAGDLAIVALETAGAASSGRGGSDGFHSVELAWWLGRLASINGVVLVEDAAVGGGGDGASDCLLLAELVRPGAGATAGPEVVPDILEPPAEGVTLAAFESDRAWHALSWLSRRWGPHQFALLALDPERRPTGADHRALRESISRFASRLR